MAFCLRPRNRKRIEDHEVDSMIGRMLLSAMLAASMMSANGQSLERPDVPEAIKAPASEDLILVAHAKGVQIYACTKNPKGEYHWDLSGPRAELLDGGNKSIGKHYGEPIGPAWELADGSKVNGKKLMAHSVPDGVPWLLITSVQNSGSGPLARVKTIQRLHTKGGSEPASACGEAQAGSRVEVPY